MSLMVVLGVASPTLAADATGTWTWEVARPNDAKSQVTLKLKQEGEKLTGTINGRRGVGIEIKDGSIKNGRISFKVTREAKNGITFVSTYNGELEGDMIRGVVVTTMGSGEGETKLKGHGEGETKSHREWQARREGD